MNRNHKPTDVVTVRGLRKLYGDRVVVHDLDLDVAAGEVVGMIGANGAGKTTTVECLQGLRHPDAGVVRVLGLDPIKDADRLRPQIGSQLQDSGLPDRLRVSEAIDLFSTARARNADELLEQFGLAARRRSAFASLSGGERQRLFLILALLNRPRLVILDELTQGLDPAARREVWTAVARLRDAGTTVLLVTHELDEAEALCERVVAMRSGRVLDAGTPAELVARHAGAAVVSFTGAAHGSARAARPAWRAGRVVRRRADHRPRRASDHRPRRRLAGRARSRARRSPRRRPRPRVRPAGPAGRHVQPAQTAPRTPPTT